MTEEKKIKHDPLTEKDIEDYLKKLDEEHLNTDQKLEKIFEKFSNGKLKVALEKLKKEIENDIKKYER